MAGITPLHKHTHPAYSWVALVVSVAVVLSVAGWYYLIYTDGLNNDIVLSSQELSMNKKATSSATTTNTTEKIDLTSETSAIDASQNQVDDTELSDTQLDNTILGIQ